MQIFEPAMCCSTGLCGVGVDPELLRISTVISALEKQNVKIDRFNLSNATAEFIKNTVVNSYIKAEGVEGLPITVVDNEIVITRRYPTNEEIAELLGISIDCSCNCDCVSEVDCSCNCDGANEDAGSYDCDCSDGKNSPNECDCSGGCC